MVVTNLSAQNDSLRVASNDKKINELNGRLDNLLQGSKNIGEDSISYKIDKLMQEVSSLKSELKNLQVSVNEIKATDAEKKKLAELTDKVNEIESGQYYIVIGSERNSKRAELMQRKLSQEHPVKVVQNSRGSWYHIVLDKPYSMPEAIKQTAFIRGKSVSDAWWVTGRKLAVGN
jgi:hypothetical protein